MPKTAIYEAHITRYAVIDNTPEIKDYPDTSATGTAMARKIREILKGGTVSVWTISPDAMVYEALTTMAEKDIGAIVVVEGKRLVGMLSERDYARRVILIGKTSREMVVQEVMSSPVCTVTPDHTISECLALMTNRRIRHLPVLEGTALCGVISIGDLVKEIVSRQISLIKGYENYIRGVYPI